MTRQQVVRAVNTAALVVLFVLCPPLAIIVYLSRLLREVEERR
jgi:hypothetical protein